MPKEIITFKKDGEEFQNNIFIKPNKVKQILNKRFSWAWSCNNVTMLPNMVKDFTNHFEEMVNDD